MEQKELEIGMNDSTEMLAEKITATADINKINGHDEDFINIKNALKKKHDHSSCKGCDGICCSKKNANNIQRK